MTDGRTNMEKTISLRLRRGIIKASDIINHNNNTEGNNSHTVILKTK